MQKPRIARFDQKPASMGAARKQRGRQHKTAEKKEETSITRKPRIPSAEETEKNTSQFLYETANEPMQSKTWQYPFCNHKPQGFLSISARGAGNDAGYHYDFYNILSEDIRNIQTENVQTSRIDLLFMIRWAYSVFLPGKMQIDGILSVWQKGREIDR